MATVLITGGTGMLGTALSRHLTSRGHSVIVLSRHVPENPLPDVEYALWDPAKEQLDEKAFQRADAIVHLAGAGVADKRWSKRRKQTILDSRVKSGQLIVNTLSRIQHQVKVVVSASAIGWYGPDPAIPNSVPFRESDPPATDFLASTCKAWEEAIQSASAYTDRMLIFRIGIVLSNTGGALTEFRKPLKWRIASILGSGKQRLSWIHIEDILRLFTTAIEQENLKGCYNAVADQPVSNRHLILALARTRWNRWFLPLRIPAFLLRLILGEMSVEVLKSTTVSNLKLREAGFQFRFPEIEEALVELEKSKAQG